MAHKIAIITDSTCDIPQKWREEFDITVIPLIIIFNNKQYLDGIEMNADQFYKKLSSEKHHPTTSNPSPNAFQEAYQKAKEKGAEQILTIVISSEMSGTFTTAKQAAQNIDIPVHVFNSRSNSMGLGWQVIAAAREREKGGNLESMIAAAERVRSNMVYFISLNTIEYLSKGGRIGDAIKLVESVLTIKPLIYVNHEVGTVAASLPARSRKLAIKGLKKEFFKKISHELPMHIAVLHNNALDEAKQLAQDITEKYNPEELIITLTSPILGVHTGPKALALCGYAEA